MDKSAIAKNLSGYIAAFIVLGGWSAFNYQTQSEFLEKLAEFEKYKTSESAKLRDKELELGKENLRLESVAKQVEEVKGQIAMTESQTDAKLRLAQDKEQLITQVAQQAQEETQIKRLMEEFSSLGVNLESHPPCDNVEALGKFNRAKAIMSQISSRAMAAGVYEKYKSFVLSNTSMIHSSRNDCR